MIILLYNLIVLQLVSLKRERFASLEFLAREIYQKLYRNSYTPFVSGAKVIVVGKIVRPTATRLARKEGHTRSCSSFSENADLFLHLA